VRTFLITIFFTASLSYLYAKSDTLGYTVVSLKEAIESNIVKTAITGSYNPKNYYRFADGNGVHYGRCMDVILESQLDTFIVLKLDAGYSLIPEDSTFQTMYVTKTQEFPLYPHSTIPFSTYAMCGEIHDKSPYYGIRYSMGGMADSILLKTIEVIEREYLQNMIGQHMLWAVANNATRNELEKYGADSICLARTVNTLNANNLSCNLINEFEKGKKHDTKPAFIKVRKVMFYTGVSYMLILTAGMIFLGVRTYTKKVKL